MPKSPLKVASRWTNRKMLTYKRAHGTQTFGRQKIILRRTLDDLSRKINSLKEGMVRLAFEAVEARLLGKLHTAAINEAIDKIEKINEALATETTPARINALRRRAILLELEVRRWRKKAKDYFATEEHYKHTIELGQKLRH